MSRRAGEHQRPAAGLGAGAAMRRRARRPSPSTRPARASMASGSRRARLRDVRRSWLVGRSWRVPAVSVGRSSARTPWSACSSAPSMMSKPSASSSSRDRERRVVVDRVEAHERVEPVVAQVLADRLHLVARAVVGRHRLVGRAVADELEDAEEADVAMRAHARVLVLESRVVAAHDLAHAGGALDEAVLLRRPRSSRAPPRSPSGGCCT